jgi:hypothetical protein
MTVCQVKRCQVAPVLVQKIFSKCEQLRSLSRAILHRYLTWRARVFVINALLLSQNLVLATSLPKTARIRVSRPLMRLAPKKTGTGSRFLRKSEWEIFWMKE